MWILTQNKERLLTTESMDEIRVAPPAPGRMDYVLLLNRKTDRKEHALGFYRRKERAKEVLQDILEKQSEYISCEGGTSLITGRHQPAFVAIPPKPMSCRWMNKEGRRDGDRKGNIRVYRE